MYNSQQKENFIHHYQRDSNNTFINSLFRLTEPMEQLWGKDVSSFSEREILELLKGFNTSSFNSLKVKLSILRTYTVWCEQNGLLPTHINCYNNLNASDVEQCTNKQKSSKIYSRERVLSLCQELENYMDSFLLLAFFEGLRGKMYEEITELTLNDIDTHYFKLPTRTIPVSSQLYNYAYLAGTTYSYVTLLSTFTEVTLHNGIEIFKSRANAVNQTPLGKKNRVSKRMLAIKAALNEPELSVSSLYYSGIKHYLTQLSEEYDYTDLLQAISDDKIYNKIVKQYNTNLPKFRLKEVLKDYI